MPCIIIWGRGSQYALQQLILVQSYEQKLIQIKHKFLHYFSAIFHFYFLGFSFFLFSGWVFCYLLSFFIAIIIIPYQWFQCHFKQLFTARYLRSFIRCLWLRWKKECRKRHAAIAFNLMIFLLRLFLAHFFLGGVSSFISHDFVLFLL